MSAADAVWLVVVLGGGAAVVLWTVLSRRRMNRKYPPRGSELHTTLPELRDRLAERTCIDHAITAASGPAVASSEGGGIWTHAAALAGNAGAPGGVPEVSGDASVAHLGVVESPAVGGVGPAGSPPVAGGPEVPPLFRRFIEANPGRAYSLTAHFPDGSVLEVSPDPLEHAGNDAIVSVLDETAAAMAEHGASDGLVAPEVWREAMDRVEAGTAPILMGPGAFIESVRPCVDVPESPVYQLEALVRVAEHIAAQDEDGRNALLEQLTILAARSLTSEQQAALFALSEALDFLVAML